MQARFLNYRSKYFWPEVIHCICQPNELERERKKLGGQTGAKKISGRDMAHPSPLRMPTAQVALGPQVSTTVFALNANSTSTIVFYLCSGIISISVQEVFAFEFISKFLGRGCKWDCASCLSPQRLMLWNKKNWSTIFLQTTGIVLRQTPLRSLETMKHKQTCDMCVLFLHPRHSNVCERKFAIAIRPHKLQTWTLYGSDASKSRSRRNCAAPCAIWQSRSISPKRRPPSLLNNNSVTCRLCEVSPPQEETFEMFQLRRRQLARRVSC